jgi:hypothetical protein
MPVRRRAVGACRIPVMAGAVLCMLSEAARAQTPITVPDTSQSTTLTVAVSEQARVTVPAGISFDVANITTGTSSGDVAISVQNIVLTSATKQLRIALTANAGSFTPPVAGATTWAAGDVSWTAGPGGGPNQWQNATGSAGTLSNSAYNPVATCNADTASCSIAKLTFTLASKPTVKRSGAHTLTVTWKFESIGS